MSDNSSRVPWLNVAPPFWAWLFAFTFWNRLYILRNRDGYHRAIFTVTSVVYDEPKAGDEVPMLSYWAKGTVEGQNERLSLVGVLEPEPESADELRSAMPAGTTFEVLFNPSLTTAIVQNETPRVVHFDEDFWEKEKRRAHKIGFLMFSPLVLAVTAKVIVATWIKSQKRTVQPIQSGRSDFVPCARKEDTGSREPYPGATPEGFTLTPSGGDALLICHKRTGMGCMNTFLVVWLTGWTFGCVFLLREFLKGGKMDDGSPMPLWFVLVFWVAEIVVASLLAYSVFCKKSLRIDGDSLTIQTDLLGFKRSKIISRGSIERLVQVKDGGEDDDSFPGWGLIVKAAKDVKLIFRQPYETSHWLGRTLASWAGVEFVEDPRECEQPVKEQGNEGDA